MGNYAQLPLPKVEPSPDYLSNKKKRVLLDLICRNNPDEQAKIRERCKKDFFFWFDHFCWFWDDFRSIKEGPVVAFEFQREMLQTIIDNVFLALEDSNHRWNAGADKARRMTATFSSLALLQWLAQFHGVSSIITSKTLEDVDKVDDMNTPFERLRWQISKQPNWLLPPGFDKTPFKHHNKKHLINFQNGGQIAGIAPTGTAMRQARALIWLADEFAFVENDDLVWSASSGTVRIRLAMSTPNGTKCKFYRLVYRRDKPKPEQFHLFELDWWRHPDNAKGLYRKPDGQLSSPFLDALWKSNTAQTMAREWLRNHRDSIGGIIYWMFRDASKRHQIEPDPWNDQILVTWDPGGVNFGVEIGQRDRYNRLLIFKEFYLTPMDERVRDTTLLRAMGEEVKRYLEQRFGSFKSFHIGDPYGSRIQLASQKKTEFQMLEEMFGFRIVSDYMYKISADQRETKRIEVVSDLMTRDVVLDDGTVSPCLLIDQDGCPLSIEAIKEGYRREVNDDGSETNKIIKSHPDEDLMDCVGMKAIYAYRHDPRFRIQSTEEIEARRDRNDRLNNYGRQMDRQKTKWRRTGRR